VIRSVAAVAWVACSVFAPGAAFASAHCFIGTLDLPAGAQEVPTGFKHAKISIYDPDRPTMAIYALGGPLKERLLTIESVGLVQTDSTTSKYVAITWLKPDRPGGFWAFMSSNGTAALDQKSIFGGRPEHNVTTVLKYGGYGVKIATDAAVFIRSICFADKKSELPEQLAVEGTAKKAP